jgi:hypothetical protein
MISAVNAFKRKLFVWKWHLDKIADVFWNVANITTECISGSKLYSGHWEQASSV